MSTHNMLFLVAFVRNKKINNPFLDEKSALSRALSMYSKGSKEIGARDNAQTDTGFHHSDMPRGHILT